MKKVLVLLIMGLVAQVLPGQSYVQFPSDSAQWNCLNWHQDSPYNIILMNYQYELRGDTIIDGKNYKKVYFVLTEYQEPPLYIGGMREDSVKNIYFFPYDTHLPPLYVTEFPNDTEEHLLYTFDSLYVGMTLPINAGNTTIEVFDIDSILIGSNYRKRYKIDNNNLMGWDYWIEGIGSNVELFSPYTEEFEWKYYTLCYTDTNTYFINSPNGEDSCHYSLLTGINEKTFGSFSIYPNPAEDIVVINCNSDFENTCISICSIQGQILQTECIETKEMKLDISYLRRGVYILMLTTNTEIKALKLIKE